MTYELSLARLAVREAACEYHRTSTCGKNSGTPTNSPFNQRDLSLACSPGAAYPCLDIQADPLLAVQYASRGNLVGVITNGTAVLGLGPELAKAARPDCIIATGGSDFPNQVNNVLCCPYIFLGALV